MHRVDLELNILFVPEFASPRHSTYSDNILVAKSNIQNIGVAHECRAHRLALVRQRVVVAYLSKIESNHILLFKSHVIRLHEAVLQVDERCDDDEDKCHHKLHSYESIAQQPARSACTETALQHKCRRKGGQIPSGVKCRNHSKQ